MIGGGGEREVNGGEIRGGDQFRGRGEVAALARFEFAERGVVGEGEFAGGGGGGEAARRAVAEQDDAGAQRLGLVDAVPEEVVGVARVGDAADEERAVGRECLGEGRGEGGVPGDLGEEGGEAAADRSGARALGPDEGRDSASSAARVLAGLE